MNDTFPTPKLFSDFVGQKRIKECLALAIVAAKKRNETTGHILLTGSSGLGKATLACIIARAMGSNLKSVNGDIIQKVGDFAGLMTNLDDGDVLFIDEMHRLSKIIEEHLYSAMRQFKLDVIIDEKSDARSVQFNLPRFTLVGSAPRKERLSTALLSCFPIIENMDNYSVEELAIIARRFANQLKIEIDEDAANKIARSSNGTPLDILNRLQHLRDYAHVKSAGKITLDIAMSALEMLASSEIAEAEGVAIDGNYIGKSFSRL